MLRTDRLTLRRWRPDDAGALAALNADPEVMRYIGTGATLDRGLSDALLERIEREWDERGFGLWAVEEDGAVLGFCGLSVPAFLPQVLPAVEVGWRLRRDAWGRGVATEAARVALAWGWEHVPDLREVLSIVHPANARSLAVCERLGMQPRADRVHPVTRERVRVLAVARP
ncbi:MAG: GNAT family N-acetyltransferase [Solirubrobacterales bacterium]|nr:GNAT family N-acetyltransferase [Solirubrobacterales bacterium]